MWSKYKYAIISFILVILLLGPVHRYVAPPMLLLERFFPGWGWLEIVVLAGYGAFVAQKMVQAPDTSHWRIRIWALFSLVFFGQLVLGLSGFEKFLMTGALHFPIPAMIVAGPIYRLQIGFMPILFLSTVILSGPAWCSQLCYFGAIDGLVARSGRPGILNNKKIIRLSVFGMIVLFALVLRLLQLEIIWGIVLISIFGIGGIGVILFFTLRKNVMVHCTMYCPVGVAVSYLKFVNPFRMTIGDECHFCGKCTRVCRYDALNPVDLKNGRPGITCTFCGDCIGTCPSRQIRYRLFRLSSEAARASWIVLTVVIHTVFLGLARI